MVEKILIDQVRGLAIEPVAKTDSWFWALGEMAVDWWNLPGDWKIFQDPSAQHFSQRGAYTTTVLLFDAHSSSEYAWGDTASGVVDDVSPAGERTFYSVLSTMFLMYFSCCLLLVMGSCCLFSILKMFW